MKLVLILLILLIVSSIADDTKSESKDNTKSKNEFKDTIEEAASIIGNPTITAAIKVIEAFKSETSTTISDKKDQHGFLDIHNNYDYGYGSVLISRFDELVNFWLEDDMYSFLTEKQKKILTRSFKEYTIQISQDPYYKQKYELSFSDGKGSIFLMIISIMPHPTNNAAVKWEKYLLKSKFVPAPSYVIVTESDCNILSCDRTDKIVYLPTALNTAHIQDIVAMNVNMLIGFSNNINAITNEN